jgi:hypothetical protein
VQVLIDRVVAGQAARLLRKVSVHFQAAGVGAFDQIARLGQARAASPGPVASETMVLTIAFPRTDAVGVAGDLVEAGIGGEPAKGASQQFRFAGGRPVVRAVERCVVGQAAVGVDVVGIDQLDQADLGLLAQGLQVGLLEALDEDRGVAVVPAGAGQRGEQLAFQRQADFLVIGRCLVSG